MIAGDNQDMGALVRGKHDAAVEAAVSAVRESPHYSSFWHDDEYAEMLRLAIAAFLRACKPSIAANCTGNDVIVDFLGGEGGSTSGEDVWVVMAKQTANELEQP